MFEYTLELMSRQPPYNRTTEFSELTRQIIKGLKALIETSGSLVLLTSSGTGAMDAAITNLFNPGERVLVVNSGTFGSRWCEICQVHGILYDSITPPPGRAVDVLEIDRVLSQNTYSALLINAHETSTGVLHDTQAIGVIASKYDLLFVVDAIGTVLADPFSMDPWNVDVSIFSSQKGLALPPGLAFVALNDKAAKKMKSIAPRSFYFNLAAYIDSQERGQMPFTPAIGLFVALQDRLDRILAEGVSPVLKNTAYLANYFRNALSTLPFSLLPDRPSNAVTAIQCRNGFNARVLVRDLAERYHYYVTSNPGPLGESLFRVGHMGHQTTSNLDSLVEALDELCGRSQPRGEKRSYEKV